MKAGEKRRTRRKSPAQAFVEVPVLLTMVLCPVCETETELWAGDDGTDCGWCGFRIIQNARSTH